MFNRLLDLTHAQAKVRVAEAHSQRLRVCTLRVHESAEGARFELEFEPGEAAQELIYPIAPHHLARAIAAQSWGPVLLAVSGEAQVVFALIVEQGAKTMLLSPRPFRAEDGRAFWETMAAKEASQTLDSVVAWGAAASWNGVGLQLAGILRAPPAGRLRWALHLHELSATANFDELPSVPTLAAAAQLVQRSELPRASGAPLVLSLWHDRLSQPWPSGDPFAARAPSLRSAGALALEWHLEREGPRADRESAPLDTLMHDLCLASGARHGQVAIAVAGQLVFSCAYTLAEAGYPRAAVADRVRLGLVSKVLTVLALQRVLAQRGLSLETRLAELPGLEALARKQLGQARLVDLVCHRAGFPRRIDIRHDDDANPLAERVLSRSLRGDDGPAQPGDLLRYLLVSDFDCRPTSETAYSNGGFVCLGELLSWLRFGDAGRYEDAVKEAFELTESPLLGSGRFAARLRGEAPAHPSLPSWEPARFGPRDREDALSLVPYRYNGAFLGPAAGWAISASQALRILAPRLPSQATSNLPRGSLDPRYGLFVAERGYMKCEKRTSSAIPIARFQHNGRLQGGCALLVHQCPFPTNEADPVTMLVALNTLYPLEYERDGRLLMAASLDTVLASLSVPRRLDAP